MRGVCLLIPFEISIAIVGTLHKQEIGMWQVSLMRYILYHLMRRVSHLPCITTSIDTAMVM